MKHPAIKGAIALVILVTGYFVAAYAWERYYLVPNAHKAVANAMRDPSSVQFRYEVYLPEHQTVCGEFNAKNAMGAYTGFLRFASNAHGRYAIEGEDMSTWKAESAANRLIAMLDLQTQRLRSINEGLANKDAAQQAQYRQYAPKPLSDAEALAELDAAAFLRTWNGMCQVH